MNTRVQRWGNSLAVRIPKPFADEVKVEQDSAVDIRVTDGKIVIAPLPPKPVSLETLLDKVTTDNLHAETGTGPAVGREVW